MNYFRYMWTGASVDADLETLIGQLNENTAPEDIFLIALPEQEGHLLDIYPVDVLEKKYFIESTELVIGVAIGLAEAEELAGGIIARVRDSMGSFDIRGYLDRSLEGGEVPLW